MMMVIPKNQRSKHLCMCFGGDTQHNQPDFKSNKFKFESYCIQDEKKIKKERERRSVFYNYFLFL